MNELYRNEHTCIMCGNTEYTSVEPVKALGDTYFLRVRYKGEWRGLARHDCDHAGWRSHATAGGW